MPSASPPSSVASVVSVSSLVAATGSACVSSAASAASSAKLGAGASSDSGSCPADGVSIQAVSPFSQVWIVGKVSVSPAASGSCSCSSNVSR
jgi:hypothetical protein